MGPGEIGEIAATLLAREPDPGPRLRILRDIVDRPARDRTLIEAEGALGASRWTSQLLGEQRDHGGWPRFHSAASRSRARFGTTERAVEQALAIGLTIRHPVLRKATSYLERLLKRELEFPDPAERNDRWPAGRELFVASTLADIDPASPLLRPIYIRWVAIAERAFASGRYSADDELAAHVELTGATTMRDSYLVLDNKYAVSLLGHVQDRLTHSTERRYLEWLLSIPRLRYIDVPAGRSLRSVGPARAAGWIRTHLLLSRFRSWSELAAPLMTDLASERDADGLWDLGPRSRLLISEHWRRPVSRKIDSTVFVLLLLKAWGAGHSRPEVLWPGRVAGGYAGEAESATRAGHNTRPSRNPGT